MPRGRLRHPGEPIRLTFVNPDVVPHNWVLLKPGTLLRVGDLVNRMVADPEAVSRHYVPRTDDALVYTDIVPAGGKFSISFRARRRQDATRTSVHFPDTGW